MSYIKDDIKDWEQYQHMFKGIWDQAGSIAEQYKTERDWEKEKLALEKAKKEAEKAKLNAEREKAKRLKAIDKDLGFQLEKLCVKEGDVIIVHLTCPPKAGLSELVHQLVELKPIKELQIPVMIIPKDLEISTMTEVEMNKLGWYKRGHRLVRPIV